RPQPRPTIHTPHESNDQHHLRILHQRQSESLRSTLFSLVRRYGLSALEPADHLNREEMIRIGIEHLLQQTDRFHGVTKPVTVQCTQDKRFHLVSFVKIIVEE